MHITCLGDSICYGYGVRPEEAWVALLGKELSAALPGVRVENAGVNGETAADGLYRLDRLLRPAPALLYVQFGLNDADMGEPVRNTWAICGKSPAALSRREPVACSSPAITRWPLKATSPAAKLTDMPPAISTPPCANPLPMSSGPYASWIWNACARGWATLANRPNCCCRTGITSARKATEHSAGCWPLYFLSALTVWE